MFYKVTLLSTFSRPVNSPKVETKLECCLGTLTELWDQALLSAGDLPNPRAQAMLDLYSTSIYWTVKPTLWSAEKRFGLWAKKFAEKAKKCAGKL